HQAVEPVVRGEGGTDDRRPRLRVAQVGGYHGRVDPERFEGASIASGQRQSSAAFGELFRDLSTDATAGASHHD
ncbi:MAG TPA: hypothetical protein VKG81_13350, partial [Mycobacterium sp.]